MLTLLLLRHARAAPQERGDDALRALTADGRADAEELGRFLAHEGHRPVRALVSPSTRTRQTLQSLEQGGGWAVPVTYDPALYDGTAAQLRATLAALADDAASVLLIGHNPAVAELALWAATAGDPQVIGAMRTRFPPCGLAVVRFDQVSWREIGGGSLGGFVTPDALRERGQGRERSQAGRRAS